MKLSGSAIKVVALAAFASIGAGVTTIAAQAQANTVNSSLHRKPIGLKPSWTIVGDVQIKPGKNASLKGVTCEQFDISLISDELVSQLDGPSMPKFIHPSQPTKLRPFKGVKSPGVLKCVYSVSGREYSGEVFRFSISGPFDNISGTDATYKVPALWGKSWLDLNVLANNSN
jgi:hypothetical protein